MIRRESRCVGCPPEMGCLCEGCPHYSVISCYCDSCKEETEDIYRVEEEDLCLDCLKERFHFDLLEELE